MRIGYFFSDVPCELSSYESYLKCPNRDEYIISLVNLYKTIAGKENITFVPFEIFSPETDSNLTANDSLLGALANGAVDTYTSWLVMTPNRYEFLSFTIPFAYDRICFYMKRPETSRITDHPLFFLTPFSISTWFLLTLTLVLMQLLLYITVRSPHRKHLSSIKEFKCVLLLAEGLLAVTYLAALREVLIESGSLKPPFRNSYETGSKLNIIQNEN